jgi:hypothetical protein
MYGIKIRSISFCRAPSLSRPQVGSCLFEAQKGSMAKWGLETFSSRYTHICLCSHR